MKSEDLRKEFTDEYSEKVKSEITSYNPDYVYWLEQKVVKNCSIPDVITPFWLWLVREAKIDVIDAENAIEVRGFLEEGDMLVPVITFAELLELYKSQNGL